jgi:hypothetical protein
MWMADLYNIAGKLVVDSGGWQAFGGEWQACSVAGGLVVVVAGLQCSRWACGGGDRLAMCSR